MTPDTRAVTTEAEFVDRLNELLDSARQNGVGIEGGWSCEQTHDPLDYEVLISAVVRPPG